eukprot:CAMPEP_0179087416 /NCGR_PEP_ID=MMETSP0796-20121207/39715_1 /TAXON_ID=73915 /ORGANISM="Pyrodinium bahamense, Strain pbaha01" /LENGTH=123 /DNA_ID=CAMNT_0020784919 /DNA_START=97 /DNA_END=469 /DNA_ORIENTATION=-
MPCKQAWEHHEWCIKNKSTCAVRDGGNYAPPQGEKLTCGAGSLLKPANTGNKFGFLSSTPKAFLKAGIPSPSSWLLLPQTDANTANAEHWIALTRSGKGVMSMLRYATPSTTNATLLSVMLKV